MAIIFGNVVPVVCMSIILIYDIGNLLNKWHIGRIPPNMPFFMCQSKLNPHSGSLSRSPGAETGCREEKSGGKNQIGSLSRSSGAETGCGEQKSCGKTHDVGF